MDTNLIYSEELLKGKRAIVTGGATGLGKAIALGLSKVGAEVTIVSRNEDALINTSREISIDTGNEVFYDIVDIRDVDSEKNCQKIMRGQRSLLITRGDSFHRKRETLPLMAGAA